MESSDELNMSTKQNGPDCLDVFEHKDMIQPSLHVIGACAWMGHD